MGMRKSQRKGAKRRCRHGWQHCGHTLGGQRQRFDKLLRRLLGKLGQAIQKYSEPV